MNSTRCLYDENAYQVSFRGTVLACEKLEDGYRVALDQTQFFPEQGGQTPDQGTLDDKEVKDVQIYDGVIWHYIAEPLEDGRIASGEVDWAYRFSNMQQHTGEHMFSGTVHKLYGYDNVGFHLSDSIVTMDFDGELTNDQVWDIEKRVNQAIVSNYPVEAYFPSEEELAALNYRSKKELEGPIRIVTIENVDVCACCAPHVKRTGEVGLLKVMSVQKYKGGVRISFLCGKRALEAFENQSQLLNKLTNLLSSSQEELPFHVERILKERGDLRYALAGLKEEMMLRQIEEIPKEQEDVVLFEDGLDARVMRTVVNKLVEDHEGVCGVFTPNENGAYQFIVGSSSLDCKEVANQMRQELLAKGGGSKEMIQGTVAATKEEIITLLCHK